MKLVLTCEHGGNLIPPEYSNLFSSDSTILETHRGYDIGALDAFEYLNTLANYSRFSTTSRLLIELNRSKNHKDLFSKFSKSLSLQEKEKVISSYYAPYRQKVENNIGKFIESGEEVFHLSVHSFTPVLHLKIRQTEIGILYDPANKNEKILSEDLKRKLHQKDKSIRIRLNYPYQGKSDGFTTFLRKKFPENYCGIELEINQKLSYNNTFPEELKCNIFAAVEEILNKKTL